MPWTKRGIGVTTAVVSVLVIVVVIILGVYVFSNIVNSLPLPNDTTATSIISNIVQQGYTGFSMMSILPIILIASIIIGLIVRAFYAGQ